MKPIISSRWNHDPAHYSVARQAPRDWRYDDEDASWDWPMVGVFAVALVAFLAALLLLALA